MLATEDANTWEEMEVSLTLREQQSYQSYVIC